MTAGLGWALVLTAFVTILVYDGALLRQGRKSMTRWMREQAAAHPWLPAVVGLVVGLVLGHLYLL